VHVSGRPLAACLTDYSAEDIGQIRVSQDGAQMRASILFGAIRADAAYEEGYGCQLTD
jgi:hypothetical protein